MVKKSPSILLHVLLRRLWLRIDLTWRRLKANWLIFRSDPLAMLGLMIIMIFALMAVIHPILIETVWPSGIYDPLTGFDMQTVPHPAPPSSRHLLGTDALGRDVLSMLLSATTPTFVIGLTAALATAIVGTLLSVIAAYFRGAADAAISNLADVFLLFPAPVIMIIVGARFRAELTPISLGLIYGFVTGMGGTVIVLRARALQVMAQPYMEASRIAGGGPFHIIIKHLLPAMLPLAALQMMVAVTGVVIADGFISFFGLTRATSNWGTVLYDAFVYSYSVGLDTATMWNALLPAAACFTFFALGFYLVSRGMHRVANPWQREEFLSRI
ncbi:MAG: ABC transporter permease [Anaerolineae bacterium]|nr:ABC transporter permease [Anaerolineae bacterium]